MSTVPTQQLFKVERALTPEAKEEALSIRFDVFIKEQCVSPDVESDEFDAVDPHWLVRTQEGVAIATARVTDKGDGVGKLERVAVLEEYRQHGIGRILVAQIENDAKTMGFTRMVLHGQTHCQGFYEKLGYRVVDPTVFDEDNIPHIKMEKAL